jgi:hypothetical protein
MMAALMLNDVRELRMESRRAVRCQAFSTTSNKEATLEVHFLRHARCLSAVANIFQSARSIVK